MKLNHIESARPIFITAFSAILYAILAFVSGIGLIMSVISAVLLFCALFFRFRVPDMPWWAKQLMILGFSILTFCIVQFAVGAHLARITVLKFILNVLIVYGLIVIIAAISKSIKAAFISVFVFSILLAVTDHFVVQTRSYEIQFSDIKSISTAMSVAGGYTFTVSNYCAGALFAALPVLLALIFNKFPKFEGMLPRTTGTVCGALSMAIVMILVSTSFGSTLISYHVQYWKYRTSEYNGFFLGLLKSITATPIRMPDGYTVDTLISGLEDVLGENAAAEQEIENKDLPNVIVVMNETFSDLNYASLLSGHDGIPTNIDPLEYFNSFNDGDDNVIKGYAYASIFGGNTANSEFEFLTGNSMAFIQSTMVPYNNLLSKDNAFSIVDIFNKYGYYTVGMHPEDKTNWSREKIYSYFGFDEQYFLRDNNTFVDDKELTEEQMFRGHVSDKTVYEKIISLYENKSEESPCFIFAVTMQNHGGYNTSDFDYTVKATDNNNSKLNEYLSSIKKSDDDLKTLFDYFSNADEETIIVFYGDHQPSLNDNVYSTYFGLDGDSSTEENMTKYVIPYMMWTNTSFGKNDTEGSFTSLNYLSPRLLDIIGLNKTAYLSLVRQVEKEAPIINAFGWWDNDMNFHSIDTIESFNKIDSSSESPTPDEDAGRQMPIVMLYYWTEYNMLRDGKNRLNEYYALNYYSSSQKKNGLNNPFSE